MDDDNDVFQINDEVQANRKSSALTYGFTRIKWKEKIPDYNGQHNDDDNMFFQGKFLFTFQ